MQSVSVSLDERSYLIHIGADLLGDPARLKSLLAPHIRGNQVVVVTNPTVQALYESRLLAALPQYSVDTFVMEDGEAHKSLATYAEAMDFLIEHRNNRNTCVIALGGGVVGDLTGFVAATYQRGVDFIQIPTTLLAQVDSSVGGKTAVNHSAGKNLIGAFYQPRVVIADTDVLSTLSEREYAAGLAEVVKYGVIADAQLFAWLEDNSSGLVGRTPETLAHAIQRSCEIKADVVARDEREGGVRAILNFGHTFGHAIESLSGYGSWLHGEAVAIGMVMAAALSERLGLIDEASVARLTKLLSDLKLPVDLQRSVAVGDMVDAMGMDIKALDGRIRFIVARSIGRAELIDDYQADALHGVLTQFCTA